MPSMNTVLGLIFVEGMLFNFKGLLNENSVSNCIHIYKISTRQSYFSRVSSGHFVNHLHVAENFQMETFKI